MQSLAELPLDADSLKAVRAFLDRVAATYPVRGAALFGSRARSNFRPDSDADVAVFLPGATGKFVSTKLAMADFAFDVLLETGIRIQPLPVRDEEWRHPELYSNPQLLHNIEREGTRL